MKVGYALFAVTFLTFGFDNSFAQNATDACPKIEIYTPHDGYKGRGETYYITASVTPTDVKPLKYRWTLSNRMPFFGEGDAIVSFIAQEKFEDANIEVRLEIEGLAKGCNNSASAHFKLLFNPGTPLVLDDFEELSAKDERLRLAAMVEQLRSLPDSKALFIVYFKSTDTKRQLTNRIRRIVNVLTITQRLSQSEYCFVFKENSSRKTRIYASPRSLDVNADWEKEIEKLNLRP